MRLEKIYIDAYKSIIKKELEISDNCLGIVGINESGKSNILKAVAKLSAENRLSITDSPKMHKLVDPYIRYEFSLDDKEHEVVVEILSSWEGQTVVGLNGMITDKMTIVYHVHFDRVNQIERRFYSVENFKITRGVFVQRCDANIRGYLVNDKEIFHPLNEAVLINTNHILANERSIRSSEKLSELIDSLDAYERDLKQLEKAESLDDGDESDTNDLEEEEETEAKQDNLESKIKDSKEVDQLKLKIKSHNVKIDVIEAQLGEFDINDRIENAKDAINESNDQIEELNDELSAAQENAKEPDEKASNTESELKELSATKKEIKNIILRIGTEKSKLKENELLLESLSENLRKKYSQDPNDLSRQLGNAVKSYIGDLIPKVIFWKHSDEYILPGETQFDKFNEVDRLDEISRPLLNLFRIGLNIKTLDELKSTIREIAEDSSERSKYEKRLNIKANNYICSVWPDYDQKINIHLESDQIIVQFYDPLCEDSASYYNMQERSDGCQTFISFLLTIGAEAKHGVIANTVLLLDEPESHLHPSGVRYMLKELIKASEHGNKVLFATHSIFMIDRDNYNRHIIVRKNKEQTNIIPSTRDRIGFFMQEEVLYATLDIDLNKDFDSTNFYNFVFEGDGDATIFEYLYSKCLTKKDRKFPLEQTSFYQGGKCSDIQKYFSHKPIQLGSKWVFILDNDVSANQLKEMIEGKYKNFLNKYVYVFQYEKKGSNGSTIELEDLLPSELVSAVFKSCINGLENFDDLEKVLASIDYNKPYSEYVNSVLDKIDNKDEFKSTFKSCLNETISKNLNKIKISDFDSVFPTYSQWAKDTISRLDKS